MLIGYARVSTDDQNLDLQKDALGATSGKRVFEERLSGAESERHGLKAALDYVRGEDILVVSLLESVGISLQPFHKFIDASSGSGKLIFHVFSFLAEFERNLIRERTTAGLQAARARGRKGVGQRC